MDGPAHVRQSDSEGEWPGMCIGCDFGSGGNCDNFIEEQSIGIFACHTRLNHRINHYMLSKKIIKIPTTTEIASACLVIARGEKWDASRFALPLLPFQTSKGLQHRLYKC